MEEEKTLPEAENTSPNGEKVKTPWQMQKESWYDKIPLNLKQLDIIIAVSLILLAITFIVMFLDAADIINPFGY